MDEVLSGVVFRPRDFLVRLRPRQETLYISQNRSVLATARDGFIRHGTPDGLYVCQTRLLSHYRYLINGAPPLPIALSNIEQHTWLGYYIMLPPGVTEERDLGSGQMEAISQHTLELKLSRFVEDGLHEDAELTNFTQQEASVTLTIEFDADFADVDEAKGDRWQAGEVHREWRKAHDAWELLIDYASEHVFNNQEGTGTKRVQRGLIVRIENPLSAPVCRSNQVSFNIRLGPHESWHTCLNFVPLIDGTAFQPPAGCPCFAGTRSEYDRRRRLFLSEATQFTAPQAETLSTVVLGTLEQAKRDLASLRLFDLDHGDRAWTMAAGLPVYVALFGRDSLTAAWQAALVSPDMMRGTLPELARWQGAEINDWRDEQPGKMLHEAHDGPLKLLNINPRQRYYGSITTSGFYPVIVSELWHWTGDKALIRPLVEPAMKALRWLDEYGDLDGDGFYEYKTRSQQGVRNQAWKDSADAIVYEDGSQVEPPTATCEEQGFCYLAKLHMSEVLWWLDQKQEARRLFHEAGELKKRFNEAFWMEKESFFALALDARKRQVRSMTSNPGHCLATGIVDESRVAPAVRRFMESDLFSGWGIRTLSSAHPAYNPYSYHRGSVWPVEQGTFAVGFVRYGCHEEVQRLARGIFEAAALFDFYRLPELFSGHPRDDSHPFPALYPQACSPQAWSASAVFCLLQALLGLYPYAPLNVVLVDPHMPEWLPEITLRNLRVGDGTATIRFYRTEKGHGDYEVLEKRGPLHVLRQPSPWSLTATFAERVADLLTSLLPGK